MGQTESTFAFYFGIALVHFMTAFIIMGIVYLIGWRKSPKWKARFLWVTFALAGLSSCLIAKSPPLGFLFGVVALILYLTGRGKEVN